MFVTSAARKSPTLSTNHIQDVQINRKSFVICSLISRYPRDLRHPTNHIHMVSLRRLAPRGWQEVSNQPLQAREAISTGLAPQPRGWISPNDIHMGQARGEHQRMRKSGDDGGRVGICRSGGDTPSKFGAQDGRGHTLNVEMEGRREFAECLDRERIDSKVQFYPPTTTCSIGTSTCEDVVPSNIIR